MSLLGEDETEQNPQEGTTMSIDSETVDLYHSLSAQAQELLFELEAFTQHLLNHPLVPRPDILLNKFRVEVRREAKLLEHHGGLLSLPEAMAALSINHNEKPSRNQEVRQAVSQVRGQSLSDENTLHRIRSSNISHLSSIWHEVKRNTAILGIRKQVRYCPDMPLTLSTAHDVSCSNKYSSQTRQRTQQFVQHSHGTKTRGKTSQIPRSEKEHVVVDIMAEHGAKWVKVFTKTQKWLMMDLAKEGLVDFADDTDEDETIGSASEANTCEALEELKLVKMAREFLTAARTMRVGQEHRHPQCYFHLPKIEKGISRDVDKVLTCIERMGIVVLGAGDLQNRSGAYWEKGDQPPSLSSIFERMICAPPQVPLTETLNIDCTVLIALISDISHFPRSSITIPKHYDGREAKKDIEGQLTHDVDDPLLPNHIYPMLRGKKLICTSKAVAHLKNIVRVMGSSTETKRSNILLVGPEDERCAREVRTRLRELSTHEIPEDLQLPIQIISFDHEDESLAEVQGSNCGTRDIEVMSLIAKHPRLSPLNRSVFFHGWRKGITTISLNRVVSEWLDRAIDAALDEIDVEVEQEASGSTSKDSQFCGPRVLICGRERSLLGTEK